ncbi:MAG: TatD family hydrolase, partial [Saprospiraceae bacterium]|nr:TatD family hydrolase [Saprospiraceae bacterium]
TARFIDESTGQSTVVAVGECGLDYFYHDDPQTHDKQKQLLRAHFELAKRYELPMIFHIRRSY